LTHSGKPIYVLGTGLSHDGSACLLKDGRICVAIEKERITRQKHDGMNDRDAVRYCLDAAGITIDDVSLIVQNANFGMLESGNDWWEGYRIIKDSVPIVTISHHLAHAYSAVGTCPFAEAAVLVMDGCGNALDECMDQDGALLPPDLPDGEYRSLFFEKDSYYTFRDGKLITNYKDFSLWGMGNRQCPMYPNSTMHSIGGLYSGASIYVFNGFEDAGKLMGLAPYGRPGVYDFEIFDLRDSRVFVRYDWMKTFRKPCRMHEQFKEHFQYYADLAYWVQREVERAILYIVNARYKLAPCENLAYAGGVALNAVANRRILKESPFKRLYIQPAAGDNGLAVGCAYYGWMHVLGKERVRHNGSPFLGRSYTPAVSQAAVQRHGPQIISSNTSDYVQRTAEMLADGKVVAWFQGGAEFGPRALGHRSILADPRRPEMRDFINSKIKFREDFRPFAPSVLLEDVPVYFDCSYESPYMILVAQVRPEWRSIIPSVVHEDQSARIQTVTAEVDPVYHELLWRFKRLTGISVLLNTSLNRRGMPIVETPEQAIEFFLGCQLDALVLDGCIVQKRHAVRVDSLPASRIFTELLKDMLCRNAPEARRMGGVYRFLVRSSWTLDLRAEQPMVFEGPHSGLADLVVEMDESDLGDLYSDPENKGALLRANRVTIQGNRKLAPNLLKIFKFSRNGELPH
jgi:carbamoyltransferase